MSKSENIFDLEYKKLNKRQKEAVDSIDGPVMVVAGPGTGKTQVLALRIGNILKKTDTPPESILCLTFTNSGVKAMKNRLEGYLGGAGGKVSVSTFHSFAMRNLIEKYYSLLDYEVEPKILTEDESVFLVDEILHQKEWEYIRPRSNPEMYFGELKQLISILKRERLSYFEFLKNLEEEIQNLKNDPESISSRGESKGKLKKEIEKKIESFEKTKEVVEFYRLYEEKKQEMCLLDYDDVLECAVKLVEKYEDVRADIYENYLYVLVDEHQDSSGVQNSFLKAVWKDTEKPNIFVVGDDRQLIYGFSGASISYFEDFSRIFKGTKLITLTENYRSVMPILSLAEALLESSLTEDKLTSNLNAKSEIYLNEYTYPRDEIIGAGLYFKKKIEEGIKPEECALLVPRNFEVRNAISVLENMGIKTSSGKNISLFETREAKSFLRILKIISEPFNSVLLSESLLDKTSGIDPLVAHKFLKSIKPEKLTIEDMKAKSLFGNNGVSEWGEKLEKMVKEFSEEDIVNIINSVGKEFLIEKAKDHESLLRNVEIVRTFIHLAEIKKDRDLKNFLDYISRLESYGNHVSLASFESNSGVQVMTLHKSKGLEYKAVWIAHMNEEVVMSGKRTSFTLPENIKKHLSEKDNLTVKRELYVAITRAKFSCAISYAEMDYEGKNLELAKIVAELPDNHFEKRSSKDTENELLKMGPKIYLPHAEKTQIDNLKALTEFVSENYANTKVSVSLLNNFFECPWKWYFRSFLKLPEMKNKSLAFGSSVHSTIEFILKNKSVPNMEVIENKIKEFLIKEEARATPSEIAKMVIDAKRAIKRFLDGFYKNIAKEYVSERPLSFRDPRFPELIMFGKLDLSERIREGEIAVTDFKTGSSKTKGVIEKIDEEGRLSSHMRQLAMYSYLVSGAEKDTKVSLSRLLYLEAPEGDKNKEYVTEITEEQIELLLNDIKEYLNEIKSGNWINRNCQHKSFGKNTSCEYCELASTLEYYRSVIEPS